MPRRIISASVGVKTSAMSSSVSGGKQTPSSLPPAATRTKHETNRPEVPNSVLCAVAAGGVAVWSCRRERRAAWRCGAAGGSGVRRCGVAFGAHMLATK